MLLHESAEPIVNVVPESRAPSLVRRLFSFPVMLAGMLVVLAVLTVRARFNDPDMWWHLKTGEIIWNTHTIPTVDLFSLHRRPSRLDCPRVAFAAHHLCRLPFRRLYRLDAVAVPVCVRVFYRGLCALRLLFLERESGVPGGASRLGFSRPSAYPFARNSLAICFLIGTADRPLGRTRDPRWFFALPFVFALWINCPWLVFLWTCRPRRLSLLLVLGFPMRTACLPPMGAAGSKNTHHRAGAFRRRAIYQSGWPQADRLSAGCDAKSAYELATHHGVAAAGFLGWPLAGPVGGCRADSPCALAPAG